MDADFPLPALAPTLKLSRAPNSDGEPVWTLHHPLSNTYYRIDWPAFECLARFAHHKRASTLKEAVERETTLTLTMDQIKDVVLFLHQNGLVALKDQKINGPVEAKKPLWKKLLQNYLYFTIPLVQPQDFLERSYKKISFMFSRLFITGMMLFLAVMIVMTLPRADEFLHTFSNLLSLEGAILTLVTLGFVKIVHEFAHAYTAIRYGVAVPHMGVAFMVMYPVLYTETTGSWRLSSSRARFHIGLAGVLAELCLAGIFLALWHVFPSGSIGQTACFLVVAVALVSSLLVNLNPLMRFDGYYMLSDLTGIDNLQARAIAFARWALRRTLFDWQDAAPESLPQERAHFLIVFGVCLLIYRFFLFIGIAFLVYHVFFQPLGLILLLVELGWFIVFPILLELKIWLSRKQDILSYGRGRVTASIATLFLLLFLLPWQGTVTLPAVLHAAEHRILYAPAPARIVELYVEEGQHVQAGDLLAIMVSPELDQNLKLAKHELDALEILRARAMTTPGLVDQDPKLSEQNLEKARITLHGFEDQKKRLTITAPFSGVVRDIGLDVREGQFVSPTERLFTIVNPERWMVSAYALESERDRLKDGTSATFIPENSFSGTRKLHVRTIAATGETIVTWPELSSLHGGSIASDAGVGHEIVARRSLYHVSLDEDSGAPPKDVLVQRGHVRMASSLSSPFVRFIKGLLEIIQREAKL